MPTIPSWTQVIDSVFTSTWSYRKPNAEKQAFLKTPIAFWLKEKDRVEPISGYTRIEIPLEYGTNDTVRWINKGTQVPINDNELVTMAYEDWKYVSVSIIRYGVDDQKNRGKARMINYAETKINAAERALWEAFEAAFWSDGSATNSPNGLANLISATPTTGTVHGLDRSTYTWWQNLQKTSTGAASVYLVSDMRTLLNNCLRYAKAEINDYFIVTDQTSYELYEDEVTEQKQISNKTLGDAGFESIQFKGRPLTWAPSAIAGQMRFINTNHIKLVVDKEYFMDMTEWKPIPDQVNDRVAQILCTLNMVTTRPIVNGVLTAIAA